MNNNKPNDEFTGLVSRYANAIAVPPFDLAAIRAKSRCYTPGRTHAGLRRQALLVATLILVAAMPALPAVIADVSRAVRAFIVTTGAPGSSTVQALSLDQAVREMPFTVIPPAGIPSGRTASISAISFPGQPTKTRLLIQYFKSDNSLDLTIIQSVADQASLDSGENIMWKPAGSVASGPVAKPPPGAWKARPVQLNTSSWIQRGTRVTLLAPPEAMTQAQLEEIRAAMSR